MLLPLEGEDELSVAPQDLLSSLLEPVLLLGGVGDGDTLGPCLPEVPAGAAPALLCFLVVTIVLNKQTLK